MSGHTPTKGPWVKRTTHRPDIWWIESGSKTVLGSDGPMFIENKADEFLILAAPDMRSAIDSAIDELQPLYDAANGIRSDVLGDVLRELRAAIAKAEGA